MEGCAVVGDDIDPSIFIGDDIGNDDGMRWWRRRSALPCVVGANATTPIDEDSMDTS